MASKHYAALGSHSHQHMHSRSAAQLIAPAADCYCIDICNRAEASQADHFVASTQGITITDPASPWHRYFNAVYAGRSPLPFDLGRVNAFYLNTPKWRDVHPDAPNPFRDCIREEVPTCAAAICARWQEELHPDPTLPRDRVVSLLWPMWLHLHARHAVETTHRLVQLVSNRTEEHGRPMFANHTWVEVLRSDARPEFQEGARAPECVDSFWNRSAQDRTSLLQTCAGADGFNGFHCAGMSCFTAAASAFVSGFNCWCNM